MALRLWLEKLGNKGKFVLYVFIPLLSMLMHSYVFNRDLVGFHVWRQTETQINIQNFAKEDFNILNPRIDSRGSGSGICRLEFPLMQWLFACFYKVFGVHIIISRILTFIIGLFSIWGFYNLLFAIFKRVPIALIGAWCFNFSPIFYYYTLNPMPDNLALCTVIWGMTFFFRWINGQKASALLTSAIFLSLATLAKLPFVIYLSMVGIYIIVGLVKKTIKPKTILDVIIVFTACFLPAVAWYLSVIGGWSDNGVVPGIIAVKLSEASQILDIMWFNLTAVLPELLINYGSVLFFLAGFWFMFKNKLNKDSRFPLFLALGISVILYFLFEMNMIAKIHDYYLFPFLPLLFLLVAYGAEQLFTTAGKKVKLFLLVLLCILPITAFLRIAHRWNTTDPGFNVDLYNYKNELRSAVSDNALCIVGDDKSGNIFFYYIHKKGWSFDMDTLSPKDIEWMIRQGAQYLYSDSRKVDSDKNIQPFFDKLLLQKGTIKVFALKDPYKLVK
jgi:hypothetical protein